MSATPVTDARAFRVLSDLQSGTREVVDAHLCRDFERKATCVHGTGNHSTEAWRVRYLCDAILNNCVTEHTKQDARLVLHALTERNVASTSETDPADRVQWIVNDNAELGVMVEGVAYFLYKGHSLIYESGKHDDGAPMVYRRVGKREFGECCYPPSLKRLPNAGGYRDADDGWREVPAQTRPLSFHSENFADYTVEIIPEGCTPTDARVLREANHALAQQVEDLRRDVAHWMKMTGLARARLDAIAAGPEEGEENVAGAQLAAYAEQLYRALDDLHGPTAEAIRAEFQGRTHALPTQGGEGEQGRHGDPGVRSPAEAARGQGAVGSDVQDVPGRRDQGREGREVNGVFPHVAEEGK